MPHTKLTMCKNNCSTLFRQGREGALKGTLLQAVKVELSSSKFRPFAPITKFIHQNIIAFCTQILKG